MKAVMYGAGNIGRGFIGQLFFNSGYSTSFVDVNKEVLGRLNSDGNYPVRVLFHEGYEEQLIENVCGVDGSDIGAVAQAIAEADIMATAVGVNVLKFIIEPLATGIELRYAQSKRPLNIIICENMLGADQYLRELIGEKLSGETRIWFYDNVGLVEASIGRMVPLQTPEMQGDSPLRVCVESFGVLPVDSAAFKGEIPKIKNMTPFSPFEVYIERKLFVHNMGHALTAYLGALYGDQYIYQSINRPEIELITLRAMTESALALSIRHKVPVIDIYNQVEDLIYRFSNKQLGDTVERVGRDLRRKLAPNDRMVGTLNSCIEAGVPYKYICLGIAAAMVFPHDKLPEEMPAGDILTQVSQIGASHKAYVLIIDLLDMLRRKTPVSKISEYLKTV